MKAFSLMLQDATSSLRIDGLTSFIGEDNSGSFGILADHARMVTTLVIGLARFRIGESNWEYLALPGAVLYFHENLLTLNTRRYLRSSDYTRISAALRDELLAEEEALRATKASLRRMQEEILKRLWAMGREGG